MNRSLELFVATLGLVALLPSASFASGWLRRCGGGCCEAAPCPAPAPPPKVELKYEDRVVTRYKPVTKFKDVEVCVTNVVAKDVVRCVMVPYTIKEQRTVCESIPIFKDVECKYTEMVPRIIKEVVPRCVTERHVKHVDDVATVCKLVPKQCVDECGRCYTSYDRVTEQVPVKRAVVECVSVVRNVEVCRTVCERVEKTTVRRVVCDYQRVEKVVEVCRIACKPEERTFKVFECVPGKEMRKVAYCEMVPYQETIRVCVTPVCESACDHGCGHGRMFGGLLSRCRGGCN